MSKRFHAPVRLVLSMAAVLAWPAASFAQVKVLMSGGFSAAADLLPEFERTTGITVTVARGESQGNGPNTIVGKLLLGGTADVVIMSRTGLGELIADGRIAVKFDTDLAQVPLGMSVRAGAPKPDIGTVDALRQTLLRAKSITFPNHTSGFEMKTKVLSQLGIADAVTGKITNKGAAAVASGESEIAIQPVSELIHAQGVDFVGTIPSQVQYISVFSAAMVAGSKKPEASKRLIDFLASENARKAINKSGMEQPRSR